MLQIFIGGCVGGSVFAVVNVVVVHGCVGVTVFWYD